MIRILGKIINVEEHEVAAGLLTSGLKVAFEDNCLKTVKQKSLTLCKLTQNGNLSRDPGKST